MKDLRLRLIILLALLASFSPPLLGNVLTLFLSPELAQTSERREAEADRLFDKGMEQSKVSQFREALQSWQRALTIYREIGDRKGEAYSLGNLGNVYQHLGDYKKAIEFHQQSLAIVREIGDWQDEAGSLGNLGIAYNYLGDYQKAIENFQQSLAIEREIGDRQGEAGSLNNLGNAYNYLGNYPKAIEFHQQSLAIHRDIGDWQGVANSLANLGNVYNSLGDYPKAIEKHQQSLAIKREIGDRKGEAYSLGNLGIAYNYLGDYPKAIENLQQTLSIAREIGDRFGEANSLNNLGNAYNSQGDYPKAIEFHQQSLIIARAIGNRQGEAHYLAYLGSAYSSQGDYPKAIENLQQSLAIAREIGDRQGEGISLNNLGLALFKSGNLNQSETTLTEAMELRESLRTNLKDTHKISLFEQQSDTYRILQQVLIARNKSDAALEIAERGRARALAELLANNLASQSNSPLTYPKLEEIKQIARQQNATLVEYSLVSSQELYIWVIQPTGSIQFRSVQLPQNTSLKDLVTRGRACIIYSDQCRSDTNQILLDQGDLVKLNDDQFDDPWQIVKVNAEEGILTLRLFDWEEGVTIYRPITDVKEIIDSPHFHRQRLQKLYQLLIQPISDLLPSDPNAHVVFIPQEELFYTPFPALQDEEGEFLIKKHTILTAPSIKVLDLTHQKAREQDKKQWKAAKENSSLVVGNPTMPKVRLLPGEKPLVLPQLPWSEDEAREIAFLLGVQPLIGEQATETAILQQLEQARFIHFATHGVLDEITGLGSAILLASSPTDDGLLSAEEILKLNIKLKAELAVLSACNTGQGRITGDGVIGLSRALISAGVPSIVVSLWSVSDSPTAQLMIRFYQNLGNTTDKAQALRQAMLTTMAEQPNPRDWAAFTLIGEAN
ncbi:CHAT domain-containing protein [Moorena sp. SIO3B2]|uniref:CHAT domain-containing protein n=1 Tax=Moorena sp. SIO3B2 TaxID=2607827 RepID=UPI0013C74B8C|nr:CHAT domain-containing protein [Moorena sp. SIO3B2]NEP34987.1 tetratricopeptide repeat protein [Moorena sp. SIO3B2]